MKKVIMLAAAALLMMSAPVFAAPCYDCDGKSNPCLDDAFECPSTTQEGCIPVTPCPAIVKVCDCADADVFEAGAEIGIRWTSLTEGVYFARDTMDASEILAIYEDQPECTDGSLEFPDNLASPDTPYGPLMDDPNIVPDDGAWPEAAHGYYRWTEFVFFDADDDTLGQGSSDYDESNCDVPADEELIMVETVDDEGEKAGYIVHEDDGLWWVIDMPTMVVDWEEAMANRGTWAQVKLELVLIEDVGICADCDIICECIVDVFRICDVDQEGTEIYFPYVLNETDFWSSGIAISNIATSVLPNEMMATFTVIDVDGMVQSAVKSDFTDQVTAWLFEDLLAELGLTVPAGPCVLQVSTNFAVDGYQFNLFAADTTMFGAGILPRKSGY